MPLISVIIPVYNGAKTIRETISSVLAQSFADLEIIVVNDGSTDATAEILADLPNRKIKVHAFPNAGPSVSRNRGFRLSAGDYIAYLDADDLWAQDKLKEQFQALQQYPAAGVAYAWTHHIDASGQFVRRGGKHQAQGSVLGHLLLTNILEHGSNPLIRRQAVAAVGGFDERLRTAEDWDFYLRLAARYEFVVVKKPLIYYRQSPHSFSGDVTRVEKDALAVIKRAFKEAPPALRPLHRQSQANIYAYLIFKALDGALERKKTLKAISYLCRAAGKNPEMRRDKMFLLQVMVKILVHSLIPEPGGTGLLKRIAGNGRFRRLPYIHAIALRYIKTLSA